MVASSGRAPSEAEPEMDLVQGGDQGRKEAKGSTCRQQLICRQDASCHGAGMGLQGTPEARGHRGLLSWDLGAKGGTRDCRALPLTNLEAASLASASGGPPPPRAVFPGPGPLLGVQPATSLLRCVGRRGATAHGKTAHPDEATPTAQSPLRSCGLSAMWPNAWRPLEVCRVQLGHPVLPLSPAWNALGH